MDAQPVVDNLPTGLIWIDEQGKILLINKKLSEDLNRVEETLEELSIFDICPSYNKKNCKENGSPFK